MTHDPLLAARGVSVELGDAEVLNGVSLDVVPGEWLGVIGPNGAGKSTLLGALAGVIAHEGTIETDAGSAPGPKDVALVPQSPLLPEGMSVAEYVLVGRTAHLGWLARESGHDRAVVAEVLRRLDLERFADRPLVELSGGEAQRVVVARALAQATPTILLDEPTSALDLGHQTNVLELLDALRRQDELAVVAAMHDLGTAARFADRLILLDGGRIVAEGPPESVLEESLLSEVYETSVRVRTVEGELVVLPGPRVRG
ncbi:MAG: ABC transporter ATP-binding protein [Actinomycetota bacterium]|nr:ABC transporter ATP-binding protein [Actinomycetota bacterium]